MISLNQINTTRDPKTLFATGKTYKSSAWTNLDFLQFTNHEFSAVMHLVPSLQD
jgi:hypothetical protein